MKHLTLLFSLLIVPYLSYSQGYHSLEFNSDNGFYNSSLSAKTLLNSLGYIDDNQKESILNSFGDENSFYVDVNNSVTFNHKKGFSISFGNHITSFGFLNKNLVKLALYGNTTFSGQNKSLLPLQAKLFHYSDISFGFKLSKKLKSSISFIAGHQFISGDFSRLNFSVGKGGEYISYDMALEGIEATSLRQMLNASDNGSSLQKELYKTNGRGVSFGFEYSGKIHGGDYNLSFQDLGFIIWDDNTQFHDLESSDLIVPLEVSDFSEIESSYFTGELDSLRDLIDPRSDSYYFALPTRLCGSFNKLFSSNILDSYTFKLDHRFNIYEVPRLSIDLHKVLKKHELVLGYHIGGMERRGTQFKYSYTAKNIQIQLFTRQANVISQNEMYGLHIGAGLKFMFGKGKIESSEEKK